MTIGFGIHLPHSWAKHRRMKWFSSWAHGKISENKAWEWQTDYFGWNTIFNLDLDLIPTGTDHAGIGFSLTILGFMVDAKIYDSRHWDEENNTWEKYDEESVKERMSREEQRRADELERAYQLVAADQRDKAKQDVLEYLETPQGKALVQSEVAKRVAELRDSKEAKKARGEAYKAANLAAKDPG